MRAGVVVEIDEKDDEERKVTFCGRILFILILRLFAKTDEETDL